MYGAQAYANQHPVLFSFENDVEMYGAQAYANQHPVLFSFENDVEMYGAQAVYVDRIRMQCLRMM